MKFRCSFFQIILTFYLILPVFLYGKLEFLPADSSGIQDTTQADSSEKAPVYRLNRIVPNSAFRVGEKLTFIIRYGFFNAGEAIMEVRDTVMINDSIPAYHIVSIARSAKFFDNFYKVRDITETYVDVKGIFSWKYYKKLREGGYKFDLNVEYQQNYGYADVGRIRYNKKEPLTIRKQSQFQLPIPEYVVDVLAAFYYVRTQELKVGEPLYMASHDNNKVYNMQVIVQKKERIEVNAGTFDCIVVQPRLKGEAIFKQKGKLWIWLTDDENKIPVQMKTKIAVGSLTTELKRIEGVPLPIKAQIE